jgi:uncharacterized DUF497 family protein
MKIVWDEHKNASNIQKHGLDFRALSMEFFRRAGVTPGNKSDRLVAIGVLDGATIVVVFRPLGAEALSVISMRRANEKERRRYRAED